MQASEGQAIRGGGGRDSGDIRCRFVEGPADIPRILEFARLFSPEITESSRNANREVQKPAKSRRITRGSKKHRINDLKSLVVQRN